MSEWESEMQICRASGGAILDTLWYFQNSFVIYVRIFGETILGIQRDLWKPSSTPFIPKTFLVVPFSLMPPQYCEAFLLFSTVFD